MAWGWWVLIGVLTVFVLAWTSLFLLTGLSYWVTAKNDKRELQRQEDIEAKLQLLQKTYGGLN